MHDIPPQWAHWFLRIISIWEPRLLISHMSHPSNILKEQVPLETVYGKDVCDILNSWDFKLLSLSLDEFGR